MGRKERGSIVKEKVMDFEKIVELLKSDDYKERAKGEYFFVKVFIVWKAKVLQNWKYLISSTLSDGMYYELTYNGDKEEWYLDAYKKFENRCIRG